MSKTIMFARQFPAYHPRKGEPTYFVDKITRSLPRMGVKPWDVPNEIFSKEIYYICEPKHHTIRAGNRWKVGDKFSPRVWSGKPYRSKQIIIAPDIEIVKIWDIIIERSVEFANDFNVAMDGSVFTAFQTLALNDGLELNDLYDWFNKPFTGQIICWDPDINY